MDDNLTKDKNQSKPIFESVPVEETPQPLQPEEVAAEVSNPDEVLGSVPPEYPTDLPPVYQENRNSYIIIIVGVLFFLAVFGGILWFLMSNKTGSATGEKKNITLTYWGLWEDKEIFDSLIQEYQKKNPTIKINYQKMDPQEYRERLIARSRNKQGPDIFRFHNTWLPEIQEVATAIPESVMTNKEFEQSFYPVHQRDLKVGTSYYGIPLELDGLVLIYNDSLLKQAGINSPPQVWVDNAGGENDVLNVVRKLTVKDSSGNLVTAGVAIGTATNVDHFSEIFALLLLLNGGDLKKLDQEEAAQALQLYRSFAENNFWTDAMPSSIPAFIQGKVAMIIAPSWQVLNIKAQNPDMAVKVAPVPKGLSGNSVSIASYWVEGVSRFSQNQLEAWKFLKYLSEKESQTKLYELQSKTRLFGEPYSRVDLADKIVSNEYIGPVVQQGQYYVSLPLVSNTFDNGLNEEVIQYLRNAINATTQGVDYTAALQTANQGIKQVFEKYKIQ